ncbi:MAG: protoporphyrinogen/coproporphyrinogen oxidase [Acidobacteriaceae bacterium]|nr:protoporphyrinogen/coproporphyrinogen oxidase [Acidobacteriaceae bacterium]MDQ1406974.1 protoporphyrinogen/coproporphyrinogen oxidase [Acidobacteriaceae bacterium]
MTAHVPTLVVGAGISGLVCAYELRKAGIDAQVVESTAIPGGVIRSERREGYLLEFGPQSFNATSALLNLWPELHIDDQLLPAPANAPRYVLVKGTLRPVPLSPPAFMASSLFSPVTKLRVVRDILGRSTPPQSNESVAAFTRRKFSRELLDKLVGPFVSGIYAGDPEKLSLRSAFPQLYEAEKSAGSVIRGLLFSARKRSASAEKSTLQTFREGNQTLIQALAANLGSNLRCGVTAQRVRLTTASRDTPILEVTLLANGRGEVLTTHRLIIATPTQQAATLLRDVDAQFESALSAIAYAPVAVVSLGYPKSAIHHSLEGFGFLVPRSSGLRVLGTVWNSSLFPNRAPDGHVLLTSFVGGATDPSAVSLAESEIVSIVHRELASVLGISQPPSFSHVQAWQRAIPQYNLGHTEHISQLDHMQRKYQAIRLIGNYLRGPALGACVEQALTIAQEAIKRDHAT